MTATLRRAGKVAGQSSWLFAGTMLARLAGLVSIGVITDVVGFEGLGRLTKVITYVTVVNSIADFRTVEAIVQHFQKALDVEAPARARAILRFCLRLDVATGCVAALLAIALAVPLTRLAPGYSDPEFVGLVAIFSISLLVSTANVAATTTLRVFERFVLVGLEEGFGGVFRRVLVIAAALWFQSLSAILWAYVIGALIQSVVLIGAAYATMRREVPPSARARLEPQERRDLLRFMVGTNVLSTVAKLGEQADTIAVNLLATDAMAGYYKLAVAGRELAAAPTIAINRVAYPRIARAVQTGVSAVRGEIRSMSLLGIAVGLGASGVLALLADTLFGDVLARGDDYGEAATLLRIMLVGTGMSAAYFWPGFVLLANRRTRDLTQLLAVVTVLSFVVLAVVVPLFGLAGAAATFSGAMIVRALGQRRLCDQKSLV